MSELGDFVFAAYAFIVKANIENLISEYENNKEYTTKKIYEDGRIVGYWVTKEDADGFRNLVEGHYLGKNRFMALRMFREMSRGAAKLRATVQKVNKPVWEAYLRQGFKIVSQNSNSLILERGD